jgi:hypothetical protein
MEDESRDWFRERITSEVESALSQLELAVEDRNGNYTWMWIIGLVMVGSVFFSYATTPGKQFDAWVPINLFGGAALVVSGIALRIHNASFIRQIQRAIKVARLRQ